MKLRRALLWLVFLVPIVFGIFRLRFDVEILNLLPGRLSVAQGLKIYQQHFSDARELIITLGGPDQDTVDTGATALAELLRAQTNLVARVTWRPGWLENPAQAQELIAALWLNQPPAIFGELTNRLRPSNLTNVLREAREELAASLSPRAFGSLGYDPYGFMHLPEAASAGVPTTGTGEEMFASPDGTFRLFFVEALPDITSYRACRDWLAQIQQVIGDAQAGGRLPAKLQIRYTGRPAFVTEIAGGMEKDMTGSAGGTLATIGILFWLTHRRLRPLLWLLTILIVILGATTAFGGLFLGTINVVSMGFASILLGLAEDFGIVIYQESRSHPELTVAQLRHEAAPGIFWSAVTTAGAFLILNLSSLPGLAQLGSLVAIGIVLAAFVMLYAYLPVLFHLRRERDQAERRERFLLFNTRGLLPAPAIWFISGILLCGSFGVLWWRGLQFDHSPNVLKPRNSTANAALEQIKERFGRTQEPLWVLVPGRNETEVSERLGAADAALRRALSNQWIASYTLPTALWPNPAYQRANRSAVAALVERRQLFRDAALEGGFTTNSLAVTESVLSHWTRALQDTNVFWPTNEASRWIFSKIASRADGGFIALGPIHPQPEPSANKTLLAHWPAELTQQGVILSGWELLGATVFDTIVAELPRVLVPIFLLVVVSLWLAFRNLKEVLMSLVTLAFSAMLLGASMVLLGWHWNILNLMALPLLLGMGVDFSIHVQLGLRRYHGDLLAVRRSISRALLLAGATTVAGFGSLAFSTNAGMASLGKVCALGITLALIVAVYLLPVWWTGARRLSPLRRPN